MNNKKIAGYNGAMGDIITVTRGLTEISFNPLTGELIKSKYAHRNDYDPDEYKYKVLIETPEQFVKAVHDRNSENWNLLN